MVSLVVILLILIDCLLIDILEQFSITSIDDYVETATQKHILATKRRRITTKSKSKSGEFCSVCLTNGELLCCDTCTLVYNLGCIRPGLAASPSGDWSCAFCQYEEAV